MEKDEMYEKKYKDSFSVFGSRNVILSLLLLGKTIQIRSYS